MEGTGIVMLDSIRLTMGGGGREHNKIFSKFGAFYFIKILPKVRQWVKFLIFEIT